MSAATPPGHSPLTPAVLHVLLALSDGPLHGYAIMRRAEEESGTEMGPGTVYGSLERLEEVGMVEEGTAPEGADRRRRYWALTAGGREALRAEAVRLERLAELVRDRGVLPESGGR